MKKENSNICAFRGDNKACIQDDLYKARIYRYDDIESIEWDVFRAQPEVPVRIILWEKSETIPVDFLFIPRDNHNLLVGLHGAEGRVKADLPKFQFVRSFINERSESLVFFSDSTLLLHPKLSLGWMVGNKNSYFLPRVTSVLKALIKNCGYDQTTLVGHSGGGFAAIAIGSQISNSKAISVNGQVVISEHTPWIVNSLQQRIFPEEENPESMISNYKNRMDLTFILRNRVENSKFFYFAHIEDLKAYSELRHFQLLADFEGVSHYGGVSKPGNEMILCKWEVIGASAHALPGTVIPFINFALGENLKMDLGIVD